MVYEFSRALYKSASGFFSMITARSVFSLRSFHKSFSQRTLPDFFSFYAYTIQSQPQFYFNRINFIFVNISFSVPRFHFFRSSPGFRHQKNAILITIPAMSRRFIFCPQILLYGFSLKNILRLR